MEEDRNFPIVFALVVVAGLIGLIGFFAGLVVGIGWLAWWVV